MYLTKVTSMCELKAPEGAKGKLVVWADTKAVVVIISITQWPEKPGKIAIFLPWGRIYGRAKKAQQLGKNTKAKGGLTMDVDAQRFFTKVNPNAVK